MKNLIVILMLIIMAGCSKEEGVGAKSINDQETKVVKLNVVMEEQRRIQEAMDNGHQPWRNNPIDVAHAALINEGINVKIEDCKVLSDNGKEAKVSVNDNKSNSYKVICKRLFKPNGIWTAVEIDMEGK